MWQLNMQANANCVRVHCVWRQKLVPAAHQYVTVGNAGCCVRSTAVLAADYELQHADM